LLCFACDTEFEFIEEPCNAFVGYLLNEDHKASGDETCLCIGCYHMTIKREVPLRPNIFSYPMRWRAKYIPKGLNLPRNGLSKPLPQPYKSDANELESVRALRARQLQSNDRQAPNSETD